MRTRYISIIFTLSAIIGFQHFSEPNLLAQTPHQEEITIIAPYEPTLPNVFKINIQPRIEDETVSIQPVVITITPQKVDITHVPETIQEAAPPVEQQSEIFRNHIRGGFGNYTTPYLEFNAGNLRSSKYLLGFQARHLSSHGQINDYGNSTFSDNLARFTAKRFLDRQTIGLEARYDHNMLHHYGFIANDFPDTIFMTSEDDTRQRFNQARVAFNVASNNRNRQGLQYHNQIEYGFINDLFQTTEHRVLLNAGFVSSQKLFRTNDLQDLGLELNFGGFYTTDTLQTWNNNIIQLKPYIRLRYQEYELKAGVNLGLDNDTTTAFRVFPMLEGRLLLVRNRLAFFVGLDGEIQNNSFYTFANENPYVQSALNYVNTVNKLRFYGGFQGSVGKRLDYTLGLSNLMADNYAFFINDTLIEPSNRFTAIYDEVTVLSGYASATYNISDQLRISTGFNYFDYSTENEEKAWHKPNYTAFLEGWYNYNRHLAFRGSLNMSGKAWAKVRNPETSQFESVEIKPWFNISLGATYKWNDQLHFFLDARNLASQQHFYWYNYPSWRINVMAGAGFSF